MTFSIIEIAVCLAMLAFLVWAIWRSGSGNPVGTGQLQNQLNTLGSKVGKIEDALPSFATTSDIEQLRGEMKDMEAHAASSAEVMSLQMAVAEMRAELRGSVKAADRTEAAVNRIESYFLEKGVKGQ